MRMDSPALLLALLLLVLSGAGGCAAAGLAVVGPMLGSFAALADRSVERTVPADLPTTWGATVDALARMAVRLETSEKSGDRWQLTGTGDGTMVYGALERVTARMTKLSVRVEVGKLLPDKQTAEELLNQVGASLAGLTGSDPRAAAEASAARLGALQREIERLGVRVEDARDSRRPEGEAAAPAQPPTLSTSPIIVVPTSAGAATVAGPAPASVHQPPAPIVRRDERQAESLPSTIPRAPRTDPADDIMATPLSSVEVLRPVEGLTIRPVRR
jgi:hypothetical protein